MSPRILPVAREEADPRSEAEFQRIESLGGYVPNIHLTFGAHPELYAQEGDRGLQGGIYGSNFGF